MLCHYSFVRKVNLKNDLLHLYVIDIDMVDKLHSLTNRGLGFEHCGFGLGIKFLASEVKSLALALTIKSLTTTLVSVLSGMHLSVMLYCCADGNQSDLTFASFQNNAQHFSVTEACIQLL